MEQHQLGTDSPWSEHECGPEGHLRGRIFEHRSHRCTSYRRESTDACSCYSCKRTPAHTNTLVTYFWTTCCYWSQLLCRGSPFHRWDRETAPSCTWFLLLRWPQAPPSSCAFDLHWSVLVSVSKDLVRHEMFYIWRISSSLMSLLTEINFETSQTPYKHWESVTQNAGFPLGSCVTHPRRASCGAPASHLYGRTSCCRFHRNTASRRVSSCA